MPEEPIHGALTYRLAIMAGFNYDDAGHLALAAAGVDHHPYMKPCTDIPRLKKEIGEGVLRHAGGTPSPRGYDRYNPHPSPETPAYVREATNQTPEAPGLQQTAYFHFRDPQVAVSQVEGLILEKGTGAASLDAAKRQRYLNDLGVAFHLLEDVGTPWAPGAHFGSPAGRFPVGDVPIGHPGRESVDLSGKPVRMYPNVGKFPFDETSRSAGDIPYNCPALFRKELPEIYRFLVAAREAFYGQPRPNAEQKRALEARTRAIPVPSAVGQEISDAIAIRTKDDARAYISNSSIWVTNAQARALGAAPDKYTPGYMAAEYKRLSPAARSAVNAQVDDRFRKQTGIMRKLDPNSKSDRANVREWLRIRDEVMTERLRYQVEPGSSDYVLIGIPSYGNWVDLNEPKASVLGTYQGVEWKWPQTKCDIGGYQ
jgi:hypothetical protein